MADERDDLLEALAAHRGFLLHTTQGLTDEQLRRRTTVSVLTLGGLVKHVSQVERAWARFVVEGPAAMAMTPDAYAEHAAGFVLGDDESFTDVRAEYQETARITDELVRSVPDLGQSHPLPEAPWFPPGATRSARRVFVHIVAETAQHAGHADIIREALDGQKTMG